MSRGQRKTIDERIESTNLQISATETKLKTLKQELADLENEKRSAEMSELYELICGYGLSIDDIRDLVQRTATESA